MLTHIKTREFANGKCHLLKTEDGYLVETTDTYLPYYTKFGGDDHTNILSDNNLGDRSQRWMIGVSTMSGCPVRCQFCSTGKLKQYRVLTSDEIVQQVIYVLNQNEQKPKHSKEFKINYTRMGEPFLNIDNVRQTIEIINEVYPHTHHYVSTIGIRESDFSWIKDNITLKISLHSLNEKRRNNLIPYKNKMSIPELGRIRTKSNLKTTINLTLVDEVDFDIKELRKYFDPEYFFIKLSPINENDISQSNNLGSGIIKVRNCV